MRSRVVLMVALLATAGIMATMAYTSAEVRNPAEATIVRTDVALLALDCNTNDPDYGYADETCWVDKDGRLHLNFAKGLKEDGEPTEEPVLVESASETPQPSGSGQKDRWYEVTLTDDQGHTFKEDTKKKKSYAIKNFTYTKNGRCINYSFEAQTKPYGANQWETVTDTLCIPADHVHEGEPTPGAPGLYGFQPGSTYRFNNLVKVTNNSNDTIEIDYNTEGDLFDGSESSLDVQVTLSETTLGPGEFAYVSFEFDVPDDWAEQTDNWFDNGDEKYPFEGTLTVTAEAIAPEE